MQSIRLFITLGLPLLLAACLEAAPITNYAEARQVFWSDLYPGTSKTLYCATEFHSEQRSGFNIEHVFPMSWVTKALSCGTRKQCRENSPRFNQIEADLHNLYPAQQNVNSARSSFRFGEVNGEPRSFGPACDFEISTRARIAEPAPEVRGDVARAMFYMAHQYRQQGLLIFNKQARLLLAWHRADPPSQDERARNDRIEYLQGNRNPFIDDPKFLDTLFEQGNF